MGLFSFRLFDKSVDRAVNVNSSNQLEVSGSLSGDVAAGGTDSGNPVKIGGKANSGIPTPVSDGQRVDAWFDLLGRLTVGLFAPRELQVKTVTTLSTTAETAITAAAGTGVFTDIVKISSYNKSGTGVDVSFRDDSGGSVSWIQHLSPRGGAVDVFSIPLVATSSNKVWTAQLSATVSSVFINIQAVKLK